MAKPYVLLEPWSILLDVAWWQNMAIKWERVKMCDLGEGGRSPRAAASGFPAWRTGLGLAELATASLGV